LQVNNLRNNIVTICLVLSAWYIQKRKKEEKAKFAALAVDVEEPVVTKRNEQGIIKLEESGYYEDEK
jgi:hypothetical protein